MSLQLNMGGRLALMGGGALRMFDEDPRLVDFYDLTACDYISGASLGGFREMFPEFAAVADSEVMMWLRLAAKLNKPDRLGEVWPEACYLFAAHNIALEMGAQRAGAAGGVPGVGAGAGAVTGKTVGSVSVTYSDGAYAVEEGAGHWNATIYGPRYWRLVRLVCAVAYQL